MNFIIRKSRLSQEEFLHCLIERFPSLKAELADEDYKGLIHLQVSVLARYTNKCLSSGQLDELQKVFDFFHQTIEKVDSATENALYVSFLEHIEMEGTSKNVEQARRFLQPQYLTIWRKLRG